MKKIIVAFLFTLTLSPVLAQNLNFDSLVNVALTNRHTAIIIASPNRDSLFKLLPSAKTYPQRIRLIYRIINNGLDFSKEELSFHHKILRWAITNKDKVSEAVITAELGYNSYENGDNTQGLQVIFKALKMAEETGNKQALGIVYQILGTCYAYNINLDKSYTLKALRFSQSAHDDLFTINATRRLGGIYYAQHKPDSGRYYLFKALELSTRINALEYICATLSSICSQEKSDTMKLKYYRARAAIAVTSRNAATISHAYDGLSDYFMRHNNPDSGLFYAGKAYYYSHNLSLLSQIRPVRLLAKLFDGRNADSALKYTKIYDLMHDSTNNITKMQDAQSLAFNEQQRRQEALKQKEAYQNSQRLYILVIVIVFLLMLALIFWRNNRQNKQAKRQIQHTLDELKATQAQLIQSEKMASLGELTAGIAHEIQNPLNFVNNFSDVSRELMEELTEELDKGDTKEAKAIAIDVIENLGKINHHGKRADAIVKGMLQHSQSGNGVKEPTNINALADEYLRLSYQGLRSKNKEFNSEIITNFDAELPKANVIPQDIGRVMLNLFNNAFYAVNQKQKTAGACYKPKVSVSTSNENGRVVIKVKDNGIGIPDAIKQKIMQPFFTTKPTGEGTGLGLSLTYDMVVKGHGGSINVESKEGEGSEFIIRL